MKPYNQPVTSIIIAGLGVVMLIASVMLSITGYQDKDTERAFLGVYGALSGVFLQAIGQALHYLAKSAHFAEEAAKLAVLRGVAVYRGAK